MRKIFTTTLMLMVMLFTSVSSRAAEADGGHVTTVRSWDFTQGKNHASEVTDCEYWSASSKGRYGLAKALEERPDLKYVADVKPDSAEDLKARFGSRVFFTPKKMGAQTSEANINAGIAAARQTVAFLRDGVDRFRVNK